MNDARFTFTFPGWFRWDLALIVAVSCLFVGLGIGLLLLQHSAQVTVLGVLMVLVVGPAGWFCLVGWQRRAERIEVGPADITLCQADGSRLSMPWDSIVEVRERTG